MNLIRIKFRMSYNFNIRLCHDSFFETLSFGNRCQLTKLQKVGCYEIFSRLIDKQYLVFDLSFAYEQQPTNEFYHIFPPLHRHLSHFSATFFRHFRHIKFKNQRKRTLAKETQKSNPRKWKHRWIFYVKTRINKTF